MTKQWYVSHFRLITGAVENFLTMKEKVARYSTIIYLMTALEELGELGAKGQSRGIVFICLEEKVSKDIWFPDSNK